MSAETLSESIVLLGPQRPVATLRAALDALRHAGDLSSGGRLVVITAGLRHDEATNAELRRDIDPTAVSLPLYAAFERLVTQAPDLVRDYKQRQSRIRKIKALYRVRLHPALAVVRRLFSRLDEDPDLVRPVLDAAVASVRDIDDQFLAHSDAVHTAFVQARNPDAHPEVALVHGRCKALLGDASAIVVAGGHVGVLRNRMEFFGLDELLGLARARGVPIISWSAGAMTLCERVVLFHDDPPHGVGDPELLDRGLGVIQGLTLFPHAGQRLRLHEAPRVAALASRFMPQTSLALESGAWLVREGDRWINRGPPESASALCADGRVLPLPAPGEPTDA